MSSFKGLFTSVFVLTVIGLSVSACQSGAEDDGRYKEVPTKTWEWRKTKIGDEPAVVTKTVTEDVKIVDRGPAWEFQGNYWLRDLGGRECILFLSSALLKPDWLSVKLSNDCSNGMRHIGGWRLIGENIALLNASGNPIGYFERDQTFKRIYKGDLTITTGERFSASLQKDL
ncbi:MULTISPECIES: AprI/Inh family metalloprotease inhibitor [unclassified Lentilitoribacter]|jgi:hypothetical protein|uniref:AprI/Inh family metalloprotease inhibitor n=1 Tax=unclassified Lentilitoribacter TaxID=2647570 RepID=UPI0013A7051B|nr:AprI/Inh family metalloprotease inhibitor [Lentilitoribacter sp. Alg239-R112]